VSALNLDTASLHFKSFTLWQTDWFATARDDQIPPEAGWNEFGAMAGRGFGKTRVGAEWMGRAAYLDPDAFPRCVVAPTQADVRLVCFEGESGLLNVIPPECVRDYNKTDIILTLVNGAQIRGFSAEKADRLRGPQHADAWCTPGDTLVRMADGTDRRVDSIRIGEFVMTRKGPRRVVMSGKSGNPNAQVRISYGASGLTATEDHPIFTSRGWVPAGEVREGDVLCAIAAWNGVEDAGIVTAAGITSGRTRAPNLSALSASIARYGSTITGRYPQVITSTTPTTMSSTTIPLTFSSWLEGTIADTISTAARSLNANAKRREGLCVASGPRLLKPPRLARRAALSFSPVLALGRRVASAAASALSGGAWLHPARSSAAAIFAARATSPNGATAAFARGAAARATASNTPSARILTPASIAERSFRGGAACVSAAKPVLTTLAVKAVEKLQTRQQVYCLKVDGEPEYFANGVLVHNCDELAAWGKDATYTLDMLEFGLRLGKHPRLLWTTTPRPVEIVRLLTTPKKGRIIVRGSTYDNKANLPDVFFDKLAQYEGTKIGRQELYGELIDPEEAGIIRRSWINLWPSTRTLPKFDYIIMSLDTAYTEKSIDKKSHDPDPTACGVWGVFQYKNMSHIMLLDCWEDHLGLPDLMKRVKREMNTPYGDDEDAALIKPLFGSDKPRTSGRKPDMLLIEDKGSGISLRQMLEREGITAYAYNPGRADKLTRLHIASPIFAQKRVWMPESEKHAGKPKTWCEPVIYQLCTFAGGNSIKHDDHVDQTTQAIRVAMDKGLIKLTKPPVNRDGDRPPPKPYNNPYAA
jgi:predicted phage terminase large subunit-like protein